jgi:hypothetical protein
LRFDSGYFPLSIFDHELDCAGFSFCLFCDGGSGLFSRSFRLGSQTRRCFCGRLFQLLWGGLGQIEFANSFSDLGRRIPSTLFRVNAGRRCFPFLAFGFCLSRSRVPTASLFFNTGADFSSLGGWFLIADADSGGCRFSCFNRALVSHLHESTVAFFGGNNFCLRKRTGFRVIALGFRLISYRFGLKGWFGLRYSGGLGLRLRLLLFGFRNRIRGRSGQALRSGFNFGDLFQLETGGSGRSSSRRADQKPVAALGAVCNAALFSD